MRVMGVDPGYGRLGVAVVETGGGERLIFSCCYQTSPSLTVPERFVSLGREFTGWCRRYRPRVLALETIFFSTNRKTAIRVAQVSGLLIYLAARQGLTIIEVNPLEVKALVGGYGKASKGQVATMVKHLLGIKDQVARHDDETDAAAVALTALSKQRRLIHNLP